MKKWFFHFDQASLLKRMTGLLVVLVLLTLAWYFLLIKQQWQEIEMKKSIENREYAVAAQVNQLSGQKRDFAFQKDLAQLKLKHVLDSLTSSADDLSVTRFTDEPKKNFPAGAARFSLASQALGVHLLPSLTQKTVKVKFNGGFYGFRDYLQAVQKSPYTVYFERVDFNMKAYPYATIMLEVFTLEGM